MAQSIGSLPLEGWYRAGRYMPVRVEGNGPSGNWLTAITADGAVPVEWEGGTGASAIVPLLTFTNTVGPLRLDGSPLTGASPLRALSSHQQLVAVAGTGDRLAQKLFPGESIVSVHVDPLDPLPGPAIAWQTLDALIVDGPWPRGLNLLKVPGLLAGGTEIAVRGADRPGGGLPWEQIDGGWVLRPAIAGPMGCDGNEAAYEPWGAWHPDLPGRVRGRVVLAGVLFSVAVLGCLLLPRKWSCVAIGMVMAFAMIAIGFWRSGMPRWSVAQGILVVEQSSAVQEDRWRFVTARQATRCGFEVEGAAWPVFADSMQPVQLGMTLKWKDGAGRFEFKLPAEGRLAFVSRAIHPQATPAPSGSSDEADTPMAGIARTLYVTDHERMSVENGSAWNAMDDSPTWAGVRVQVGNR
jgi:hypothetical protein